MTPLSCARAALRPEPRAPYSSCARKAICRSSSRQRRGPSRGSFIIRREIGRLAPASEPLAGFRGSLRLCPSETIHSIHTYPQQFTERKRSKKKEDRPMKDISTWTNYRTFLLCLDRSPPKARGARARVGGGDGGGVEEEKEEEEEEGGAGGSHACVVAARGVGCQR